MAFVSDTAILWRYEVKRLLRSPALIAVGLVQPLLWLVLYAPLLNQVSVPGVGQEQMFDRFAPGLLVLLALFGSLYTGFGMVSELRSGVVERLAATRMSRAALIVAKLLRDVVIVLPQALVLLVIAFAMGLDFSAGGLLLALVLFVLITMLTAAFSYAIALAVRDENVLSQLLGFLSLPLLLLSGVVLPISLAPDWLRVVAQVNPFYHVVEASRALFAGAFTDSSVPIAFGVISVLTLLTVRWSIGSLRNV
ncbi:ABC transporter permease [Actinosynnema sp. NPDC047251]|uniref:Transport permease protein n=1 Tax=Saccharothrix espanaensis (strain ATCC 51144 / DSM 44229 / JCM 9112 / NBRC 15066 / NRRL 15764) TaxID=1179773 RepID=K0K7R7_SACES|nr:ABC transporter permease [Saccharothrix espanaensis]CCH32668.1 ABC-2 type transporter [Saccharothrix espanaensis DSM 44229]